MAYRHGVDVDHGAVGQRPPKGARGALVQVPGDEAGECRKVVATAVQGLVYSLLHEVLVHALNDKACLVVMVRARACVRRGGG